jgi:hypothetical protein
MGKDLILTGEYLSVLVLQTLQLDQLWLAHGVAAAIMENKINNDALTDYYQNGGDIGIIGLFNARFYTSVSGDDVEIVNQTAVSLYNYIQRTYGNDECLRLLLGTSNLNLKEAKTNWLKSIKVSIPYDYKFEGALTEYMVYRSTKFDLYIEGPYANYDVQMYLDGSHDLSSPYRLELFLYHNYLAVKELKEILFAQASAKSLNLNKIPLYQINWDRSQKCVANYNENIIYLQSDNLLIAQLHEFVHIIASVSDNYTAEDTWIQEGFASFMTTAVKNENSCYFHDSPSHPDSTLEYLFINAIQDNGMMDQY